MTAPIRMMVVTPIMMPSTVSRDRSGLRRSTSSASSTASFASMNFADRLLAIGAASFPLIGPERYHWVESRGFGGRIDSEEQSYAGGYQQTHDDGPQLHGARQCGGQRDDL